MPAATKPQVIPTRNCFVNVFIQFTPQNIFPISITASAAFYTGNTLRGTEHIKLSAHRPPLCPGSSLIRQYKSAELKILLDFQ